MTELVVLVVVLLVVLGAIAGGVVVALRRRRGDRPPATERPVAGSPQARALPKAPGGRERRGAPDTPAQLRPLSAATRQRYLAAWEGVQTRAVDRPVLALSEADTIVARLLRERGLPEPELRTEADQRVVEGLGAAHRQVLDSYRAGHALEQANSSSRSDPEQVSEGMVHLQRAFLLLVEQEAAPYGPGRQGPASEQRRRTGLG